MERKAMTLSEERLRVAHDRCAVLDGINNDDLVAMLDAADALSLRSDAHTSGEVKQLQWQREDIDGTVWTGVVAISGQYLVKHNGINWEAVRGILLVGEYETREAAQAGSQAHFETRIRSALDLGHPIQGEAEPNEEIDGLRRAVWRLSGSGMSFNSFWNAYGNKLEALTKTTVKRNEAQPPTPAGVREITDEIPVPKAVVEIARDLITLYGRNPEWTHVADKLSAALTAAKGAGE